MKRLPRIKSAEAVIQGVLKIVWTDGYEGIVDLRPLIDKGLAYTWLQNPLNFKKFQIEEFGHSIGWFTEDEKEIDFGADNLREKAENQESLQKLVSNMHV